MIGNRTISGAERRLEKSREAWFQSDVVAGLSSAPKRLPCKYFYDLRGSRLFDAICDLDEYYLTRTELAIMRRYSPAMAEVIGKHAMLIEYGSGSSIKTRLLLDQLAAPTSYVPVDISRKHLHQSARTLANLYPHIEVLPVSADFTAEFELPGSLKEPSRRIVYFPGSTIGNFERPAAVELLSHMANQCGQNGGVLVGIDLQKDVSIIEAAYNDAQGITAEFNLNLLARINRELGGDFAIDQFQHLAFYDRLHHRVDLRLVSRCEQRVQIGPHSFRFFAAEPIHTEFSHKYSLDQSTQMAGEAGLTVEHVWTDGRSYFAVVYLSAHALMDRNHHHISRRPR